jgi:uncharacterized membrane protein
MRFPRVRFTVRRMMIAAAVAALLIMGAQTACRRRAEHHGAEEAKLKAELASALAFKRENGDFPGCGWAKACLSR